MQKLFAEGAEELEDFQSRFFKLQALISESENSGQLLQECLRLKQDVYEQLSNKPEIREISGQFSETRKIIEGIKSANSNYAGFVSNSEMEILGKISSGEMISGLKGISSSLKRLNSGVDYFSNEVLEGLEVLCDTRINAIREGINNAAENARVADIKARLAYGIANYLDSNSQKEKLTA